MRPGPTQPGAARLALLLPMMVCAAAGCGGRSPGLYECLQSGEHDVLARAAVEAGQRHDEQSVPYLIDRLEHESPAVRLAAVGSLKQITGEDLGFSALASEPQRLEAVGRWRAWLRRQGHSPREGG